jgi:hypothetical protein
MPDASSGALRGLYPALTRAFNAGMRDAQIKISTWGQLNFTKKYLTVESSKTEVGEGRTITCNLTL